MNATSGEQLPDMQVPGMFPVLLLFSSDPALSSRYATISYPVSSSKIC
jgi:hypothetical protein